MVSLIRRADVNGADKRERALGWSKKVARYVEGRFGYSKVECGVEIFGSSGRLYWIGRQESLESLAAGSLEALRDETYLGMVSEAVELIVPGSVADTVMVAI